MTDLSRPPYCVQAHDDVERRLERLENGLDSLRHDISTLSVAVATQAGTIGSLQAWQASMSAKLDKIDGEIVKVKEGQARFYGVATGVIAVATIATNVILKLI